MNGMPIIETMKALALALIVTAIPPAFTLEEGLASWYGGKFQGRLTSSGEVFDTNLLTAAHKTLPFGTLVKVTNLANGRSAVVKINDRGPFVEGRIIDLSRAAAEQIDMVGTGHCPGVRRSAFLRLGPVRDPGRRVRAGTERREGPEASRGGRFPRLGRAHRARRDARPGSRRERKRP